MTKKKAVAGSKVKKVKDEAAGTEFVPSPEDCEAVRGNIEKRTERVPCPELNDIFGVPEGANVTFVLTQCDLSTYLRLQGERQGVTQALVGGILRALQVGDEEEVGQLLSSHFFGGNEGKELSPQAKFEIDICRACVLEPELKRSYWIFLADMFPMVVNRVSNKIVDLTLKGGIKKN